jgi:hypothetical protein
MTIRDPIMTFPSEGVANGDSKGGLVTADDIAAPLWVSRRAGGGGAGFLLCEDRDVEEASRLDAERAGR